MPEFGAKSKERLETCHHDLRVVCNAVIPHFNFIVLCGRRGEAEQEAAFESGRSLKRWPESKHNAIFPLLSGAVDVAPWHAEAPHIRWANEREFLYLAGHLAQAAAALSVPLRWGGDWDQDKDLYDINKPWDLGHFELADW